jgi:Ca2+-binding RTX toxin-like protein
MTRTHRIAILAATAAGRWPYRPGERRHRDRHGYQRRDHRRRHGRDDHHRDRQRPADAQLPHHGTGFANATDFDSDPGVIKTLPAATGTLEIDAKGGDDIISAGPNADIIHGGTGSDRITGFRGDDTQDGGEGNDVFIWNNGDGTDTTDGDAGNDEQVFNGRNTTDDMTVKNDSGRVEFERAAPGKIGLDMGPTLERLNVNAFSGRRHARHQHAGT